MSLISPPTPTNSTDPGGVELLFRLSSNLGVILLILSLLTACEEPVDLIDFEERLAVTCQFSPGEPFNVYVSKSLDPLSNQDIDFLDYLDTANVTIYQGDAILCEIPYQPAANYPNDRFLNESCWGEVGIPYTLRVSAPGFEEVFATDVIPSKTEINSFEMSDLEVELLSDGVANFQFNTKLILGATKNTENYYLLNFIYEEIPFQVLGNDTIFDQTGEYIALELESLEGNPPSLKDFDEKLGAILFSNESSNPLELNFQLNTPNGIPPMELFDQVYVNLKTVSKSYYYYHLQLSRQLLQKDTFLVNPVILADNIENGYGIFAGYQLTKDSILIE